jgi:hypothetical protein
MNYTSVSREDLQKAFGLAHKLSERAAVPNAQRAQFRAIAYLIWKAHGEPGTPPTESGQIVLSTLQTTPEELTALPDTSNQPSAETRPTTEDRLSTLEREKNDLTQEMRRQNETLKDFDARINELEWGRFVKAAEWLRAHPDYDTAPKPEPDYQGIDRRAAAAMSPAEDSGGAAR